MAYELTLHDLGEGLTEAEVIAWLVAVGEPVRAGDALVEVETAKTTAEITAPRDGVLLHQGAAPGATLAVGRLLAVIGDPGESWSPQDVTTTVAPGSTPAPATDSKTATSVKAMPVVRKRAADLGVDLAAVVGTGPGGAITRDDVERAASAPAATPGGEPLSATRRAIAAHLTRSWTEIPHVTVWGLQTPPGSSPPGVTEGAGRWRRGSPPPSCPLWPISPTATPPSTVPSSDTPPRSTSGWRSTPRPG